jgi:hypothetical protein
MRAVLRRHAGRADPVIALGNLRMNPATHELTQNGQPIVSRRVSSRCCRRCSSSRVYRCRGQDSRSTCTAGARKSKATRSRSTSTRCAESSAPSASGTSAVSATWCPPAYEVDPPPAAGRTIVGDHADHAARRTGDLPDGARGGQRDVRLPPAATGLVVAQSGLPECAPARLPDGRRRAGLLDPDLAPGRDPHLPFAPPPGTSAPDADRLCDDRQRPWQVAGFRLAAGRADDPGGATDAGARPVGAGCRLADGGAVPAHAADARSADLGRGRTWTATARCCGAGGEHAHAGRARSPCRTSVSPAKCCRCCWR